MHFPERLDDTPFNTAILQNFQETFRLCVFRAITFITAIIWPKIGKKSH